MNAEELEKRIGELALEFAKIHDEEVENEFEALRGRVGAMRGRADLGRCLRRRLTRIPSGFLPFLLDVFHNLGAMRPRYI